MRFGPPFAQAAIENSDKKVSPRVLCKLTIDPPSQTLVNNYLREIARTYNVNWVDNDDLSDDDSGDGGGIAVLEPPLESDFGDVTKLEPIVIAPPTPTSENLHPQIKVPPNSMSIRRVSDSKPSQSKPATNIVEDTSSVPSLDDLMSRFEALKKR